MPGVDDDHSRLPGARVKRSLLNGPVLCSRAKLDWQWAKTLRQTVREQNAAIDAEEVEKKERAAREIMAVFANILFELLGHAGMTLAFYELASATAPFNSLGRPSAHDPAHLADLEQMVVMREGILGLRGAISEVVANEPREHRAALRNHLHRRLR